MIIEDNVELLELYTKVLSKTHEVSSFSSKTLKSLVEAA